MRSRVESLERKNDSSCKTLSYQAGNCFILAEGVASIIMIQLARVMQIIISLARFEMIRQPPFFLSSSDSPSCSLICLQFRLRGELECYKSPIRTERNVTKRATASSSWLRVILITLMMTPLKIHQNIPSCYWRLSSPRPGLLHIACHKFLRPLAIDHTGTGSNDTALHNVTRLMKPPGGWHPNQDQVIDCHRILNPATKLTIWSGRVPRSPEMSL